MRIYPTTPWKVNIWSVSFEYAPHIHDNIPLSSPLKGIERKIQFALCTNLPEKGTHCIVTSLSANQYFLIKLDSVSCTHYFMSIHNLRYSVQLIKIATRNKKIFDKIPRCRLFKQLCARHSYVCRHGLYVVYIVMQTPSFRRSRDLDKSNKFRQMQELMDPQPGAALLL